MRKLYWLDDDAWPRIEPLLPRGRRGAHVQGGDKTSHWSAGVVLSVAA